MTTWQSKLEDFNVRVKRFRLTHPYYVPRLSDFVEPDIWTMMSETMLKEEDQTDSGPPNDDAVDDMLRGEGKYADYEKERSRMMHTNPLQAFEAIRWTLKATNVEGFEACASQWRKLTRTMCKVQLPKQKELCKIMFEKIRPAELKRRVREKMSNGLGPDRKCRKPEAWRMRAVKELKSSPSIHTSYFKQH